MDGYTIAWKSPPTDVTETVTLSRNKPLCLCSRLNGLAGASRHPRFLLSFFLFFNPLHVLHLRRLEYGHIARASRLMRRPTSCNCVVIGGHTNRGSQATPSYRLSSMTHTYLGPRTGYYYYNLILRSRRSRFPSVAVTRVASHYLARFYPPVLFTLCSLRLYLLAFSPALLFSDSVV
jgi:hypothetical protein